MARGVFFYAKANSLRQELYVEPNPDNGLATLAKLHFDRLSRADELMLTAASEGKPTRIEKPSQGGENDLSCRTRGIQIDASARASYAGCASMSMQANSSIRKGFVFQAV
jgi:hypothetical protein